MISVNRIFREHGHQFIYDFDNYKKEKGEEIEKNYWVTVIGDFIFEARFPKYIFELIEKIYQEVQSLSEFDASRLNYLFQEPGNATLTISHNKKRASNLREEVKILYEKYGK